MQVAWKSGKSDCPNPGLSPGGWTARGLNRFPAGAAPRHCWSGTGPSVQQQLRMHQHLLPPAIGQMKEAENFHEPLQGGFQGKSKWSSVKPVVKDTLWECACHGEHVELVGNSYGNRFSPTMRLPEIELKPSGLAASALIH